MPINATKAIISIGVGVADEALGYWDEQSGRAESFKNAADIGRLLAAMTGYGLQAFSPRHAAIGETIATAATPLLVKSISAVIRRQIGQSAAAFRPRMAAATMRPMLNAPGARVGAQLPEFESVRIW